MKVHHLNCGTMKPPASASVVGNVRLVETDNGLVLIDTGSGSTTARSCGWSDLRHSQTRPKSRRNCCPPSRATGLQALRCPRIVVNDLDLVDIGVDRLRLPEAEIHITVAEALGAIISSPSRFQKYVVYVLNGHTSRKSVSNMIRKEKWPRLCAAKQLDELCTGSSSAARPRPAATTRWSLTPATDGRRHGGDAPRS